MDRLTDQQSKNGVACETSLRYPRESRAGSGRTPDTAGTVGHAKECFRVGVLKLPAAIRAPAVLPRGSVAGGGCYRSCTP